MIYLQQSQSHKDSLYQGQDTIEFLNAKVCDQELSDCFVETPQDGPCGIYILTGFSEKNVTG